eukprot:8641168-Heterocapsa_arctica.AAC.1
MPSHCTGDVSPTCGNSLIMPFSPIPFLSAMHASFAILRLFPLAQYQWYLLPSLTFVSYPIGITWLIDLVPRFMGPASCFTFVMVK